MDLQEAQLDRQKVVEHYAMTQEKNQESANRKYQDKRIEEGQLVLRYDLALDSTFRKKFVTRWEGPFQVTHKFSNGSYQLEDLDASLHKNRVNGFRLKKYSARMMQVSSCGPIVMKEDKPEDLMDEDISEEMKNPFPPGC